MAKLTAGTDAVALYLYHCIYFSNYLFHGTRMAYITLQVGHVLKYVANGPELLCYQNTF